MTNDADVLTRRMVIRSGAVMAAGSLCPPWALGVAYDESGSGDAGSAAKRWTIGNELVKRVVSFTPGAGVFTSNLDSTNAVLISGGKAPRHGNRSSRFCVTDEKSRRARPLNCRGRRVGSSQR
jgi:hypothetical protein